MSWYWCRISIMKKAFLRLLADKIQKLKQDSKTSLILQMETGNDEGVYLHIGT